MVKLMKVKAHKNLGIFGQKYSINRSQVFLVLYLFGQNLI